MDVYKKGTYTSTVTCVHGYMILKEHNHDADTEEITRRILNKKSKEVGKDNCYMICAPLARKRRKRK